MSAFNGAAARAGPGASNSTASMLATANRARAMDGMGTDTGGSQSRPPVTVDGIVSLWPGALAVAPPAAAMKNADGEPGCAVARSRVRRLPRGSAVVAVAGGRDRRSGARRRGGNRTCDARPRRSGSGGGRAGQRGGVACCARAPCREGWRSTTVVADARSFELERRFSLIVVPMQTLQLLGGPRVARRSCAARARICSRAGWSPRRWPTRWTASTTSTTRHRRPTLATSREVRYTSQLLAVLDDGGRAAIHRRREIIGPGRRPHAEDVVVHLDRVSAQQVAAEAARLGFLVEPHRRIPESERYLGSTIVVLRKL